jgi:hypothetical protein
MKPVALVSSIMRLSAEERLILVRVKIKRAKKHLAELEACAEPYRDVYAHVILAKDKFKIPQHVSDLRKLPVVSFEMLAIAGDVLHNLRSALDHLIYQLVLVRNPRVSTTARTKSSFPIGKDLHGYESLRGKIKGLIELRALKFIDSLKPYKGGNPALWKLHESNNIDKHRRLISVGRNILCEGEGFLGQYWLKDSDPPFSRMDVSKRQRLTKITGIRSMPKFRHVQSKALIPTLRELTHFVETLVEDFRALLAKP